MENYTGMIGVGGLMDHFGGLIKKSRVLNTSHVWRDYGNEVYGT